jgi:hypothetical protein
VTVRPSFSPKRTLRVSPGSQAWTSITPSLGWQLTVARTRRSLSVRHSVVPEIHVK